jgi:hypothetical protein
MTDITTQLQSAVNAAVTPGAIVQIPDGNSFISDAITLSGKIGLTIRGTNTYAAKLYWNGPADRPAFLAQGCYEPRFEEFSLYVNKPLLEGVRFQTMLNSPAYTTGQRARMRRVCINGANVPLNVCVRFAVGSAGDQGNAEDLIDDCLFMGYAYAGIEVDHQQCKNVTLFKTGMNGGGIGKYGIKSKGSVQIVGGGGGGNTAADIWITDADDRFSVDFYDSEGSSRFLIVATDNPAMPNGYGYSGASQPISLRNIRWTGSNVAPDGYAILRQLPGPLSIDGTYCWKQQTVKLWAHTNFPVGTQNLPDLELVNGAGAVKQ